MQSQRDWQFRCPKCDLYHSTLVPGPGTGIEGLEDLRRANFELMLDRAEKARSLSGLRLLEVGSAKGWFLEAATRRGMVAHGLEPEEANVRIARSNGLSAESGFFPADLQDHGPYDVIAFNDVFEHLPSPVLAIRRVEELLSVDGTVVINLPSSEGALFGSPHCLRRWGSPRHWSGCGKWDFRHHTSGISARRTLRCWSVVIQSLRWTMRSHCRV